MDLVEFKKRVFDIRSISAGTKSIIPQIEKLYTDISIPMDAGVKPACVMERPRIEDFYPDGTDVKTIQNAFIENIEIYNYINALDLYIDEIESNQV